MGADKRVAVRGRAEPGAARSPTAGWPDARQPDKFLGVLAVLAFALSCFAAAGEPGLFNCSPALGAVARLLSAPLIVPLLLFSGGVPGLTGPEGVAAAV